MLRLVSSRLLLGILAPAQKPCEGRRRRFSFFVAELRNNGPVGPARMRLDGLKQRPSLRRKPHSVSAPVFHRSFALYDAPAQETVNNIGERRAVYPRQPYQIGL